MVHKKISKFPFEHVDWNFIYGEYNIKKEALSAVKYLNKKYKGYKFYVDPHPYKERTWIIKDVRQTIHGREMY